jgi:hypothetical protein
MPARSAGAGRFGIQTVSCPTRGSSFLLFQSKAQVTDLRQRDLTTFTCFPKHKSEIAFFAWFPKSWFISGQSIPSRRTLIWKITLNFQILIL